LIFLRSPAVGARTSIMGGNNGVFPIRDSPDGRTGVRVNISMLQSLESVLERRALRLQTTQCTDHDGCDVQERETTVTLDEFHQGIFRAIAQRQ